MAPTNLWVIEVKWPESNTWRNPKPSDRNKQYGGFLPNKQFLGADHAITCAQAYRHTIGRIDVRVISTDTGYVCWDSTNGNTIKPLTAGEENMEPDIQKPLTIPRAKVVERLEEHLAEEVKKREDAEKEKEKAREDALEAIAKFTPDELYNIFANNYTTEVKDLQWDKENKSWVTAEVKPTVLESDLEKFVRVLKMANDETVEITPQHQIYRLL